MTRAQEVLLWRTMKLIALAFLCHCTHRHRQNSAGWRSKTDEEHISSINICKGGASWASTLDLTIWMRQYSKWDFEVLAQITILCLCYCDKLSYYCTTVTHTNFFLVRLHWMSLPSLASMMCSPYIYGTRISWKLGKSFLPLNISWLTYALNMKICTSLFSRR